MSFTSDINKQFTDINTHILHAVLNDITPTPYRGLRLERPTLNGHIPLARGGA